MKPDKAESPIDDFPLESLRITPLLVIFWTIGFAFLFFLCFFVLARHHDRPSPHWQSRAKSVLRSIGASQLAYRDQNDHGNYGSFEALQRDLYIAEDYTLDNIIEHYTLTWDVTNLSTVSPEGIIGEDIHTFTVIAWPQGPRSRGLHTFGITEDQVAREFDPRHGNRVEEVKSWDPIL